MYFWTNNHFNDRYNIIEKDISLVSIDYVKNTTNLVNKRKKNISENLDTSFEYV